MKDLPNIEPSAFVKGAYVGYSKGPGPWRIRKVRGDAGRANGWYAFRYAETLYARTLSEMSDKLAAIQVSYV
jgi:hypothetical protein